jgi:hypothetical protein
MRDVRLAPVECRQATNAGSVAIPWSALSTASTPGFTASGNEPLHTITLEASRTSKNSLALGLGLGIGALAALASLARDGELPTTPWGFRALSGPFGRLDPQQFTPLGLGLVGVCAVDAIAGVWLWHGKESVAILWQRSERAGAAGAGLRDERRDVLKLSAALHSVPSQSLKVASRP